MPGVSSDEQTSCDTASGKTRPRDGEQFEPGSSTSTDRTEDRTRPALAPHGCASAPGHVTHILENTAPSLPDDRRRHAQNATAIQGPAGRQPRSHRQREHHTRTCRRCGSTEISVAATARPRIRSRSREAARNSCRISIASSDAGGADPDSAINQGHRAAMNLLNTHRHEPRMHCKTYIDGIIPNEDLISTQQNGAK